MKLRNKLEFAGDDLISLQHNFSLLRYNGVRLYKVLHLSKVKNKHWLGWLFPSLNKWEDAVVYVRVTYEKIWKEEYKFVESGDIYVRRLKHFDSKSWDFIRL